MFDEKFWVALSFVIFISTFGIIIYKKIVAFIDVKRDEIDAKLNKAEEIRKEAELINANAKERERLAKIKAEEIIDAAKNQAKIMLENSQAEIEKKVNRKMEIILDKIETEKLLFIESVKNRSVDIALNSIKDFLAKEQDSLPPVSSEDIKNILTKSKN